MKKSTLYTRKGDSGTTSLADGIRVRKNDLRLEAYGTIDELNAFTGLLIEKIQDSETCRFLFTVQNRLFQAGAYLANAKPDATAVLTEEALLEMEAEIDALDATLPSLRSFVLPRGSQTAALAHICRTVARRAERNICALNEVIPLNDSLLQYINRLSDYFFVLARSECAKVNNEKYWNNTCI